MSLLDSLIAQITSINKLQQKFLESSINKLTSDDIASLEAYLKYCINNDLTLVYLAKCYDLIVKDTLREQIYFKKSGSYRYSSYRDVAGLVYHNDEYMKMYMHGLALTAFLWPNHAMMMSYFRNTIPRDKSGNYVEIGPGHGFYFMEAMRLSAYEKYYGIDLSPTSVLMTNALLKSKSFGDFSNFKIEEGDFFKWNTQQKFDAVVMGEVLEHVESPELFLRKIAEITGAESYIFVTTCINSPAIDHIYLFKDYDQINDIIDVSGLYIKDKLLIPYNNLTLEDSTRQKLPINVAVVLGNKNE